MRVGKLLGDSGDLIVDMAVGQLFGTSLVTIGRVLALACLLAYR